MIVLKRIGQSCAMVLKHQRSLHVTSVNFDVEVQACEDDEIINQNEITILNFMTRMAKKFKQIWIQLTTF